MQTSNCPKHGNSLCLDKNESSKQDNAYPTENESTKQGIPHLTENDSIKQGIPHLTENDSTKQGIPHLTENDSTKQGIPHLTENDSTKQGIPHLTENDSTKQGIPHLTENDSTKQGIPHLTENDSTKQGIPHLTENDSTKQGIPHLTENDSTKQGIPHLTENDSTKQGIPHLTENDSTKQGIPHLTENDSTKQGTPHLTKNNSLKQVDPAAHRGKKKSSNQGKPPHQEDSLGKPTAPKTSELTSDNLGSTSDRNTFSELKKETKSVTLADGLTSVLECLGFKKHCEDIFSGLTLQFNKEQNFIVLESETDYCKVVKEEASRFLDKCKKCSWKLDSRQTFLLTECPSKIAWWIDLCYTNYVYCCFDLLQKEISIYAKSVKTLQKCREYFDTQMHFEAFYFTLDDNQKVESYLKELQRTEQNFYFSRPTDRRVELVCLSQFSKKITEHIRVHFSLSETDNTHPETLSSNKSQNDNDQNQTDNSEGNMQMKSQGSVDTERQLESQCTTDVREKSPQQAIDQDCLGDAVTSFSPSKLEANTKSPSSSAQRLPASVTDGLVQNKTGSTQLLNDDSSKYNNNVNVEKKLEGENQHLLNDSHSNEPNVCEEQKTDRLQLTRLEAELISHPEVKKELLLFLVEKDQHVKFHLDEGFLEIKSGDQKTLKDILESEIHTELITADEDEQALAQPKFSCYLVKKFDPELKQITIVFHKMISKDLQPIIGQLKFSSYFCTFPLYRTTYTKSYLAKVAEIIQSHFEFKVDVKVICDDSYASSQGFNITTEKRKLKEVKSTVDHLLKAIQIKTVMLKPHDANRILSSQGQQYLMQLEEEHKCQINVVSCDRHVFMHASCTSGLKLFMMEGTMATADCQILVLPLCDGQKQWPSQYKSILEKNFLTTDMGQFSGIRSPPSPCTLSLECNGEAKGQTVVVMYVPSRKDKNFNDSIAKVCEIMLSEISGKSTIAMPLELSTDISYKESLPVILRVIREHTLKNENKPFSMFIYVGDQTLQSLKAIAESVKTLLGREEKFPSWKTNILPLGPYHRVKIMEADLEKVKADVIVNSTDPDLLHTRGALSKALLKAAGPEMADQCKELYSEGIGNRIVVATDSFRLDGAKAIFHIVLPQELWSHKTGAEEVRSRVRACLMEASIYEFKSIAFPALGVGTLGYPPDIVAHTMFMAATDFFLRMPESTVENVYFVCHPFDKKAVNAFKVEDERQKRKLQRPADEQNECKEYLLSLGDYKLLIILSDEQIDPILTDFIIIASGSQANTVTDYQRNNSAKKIYIQTQAKHIQHVFKRCVDFKQCRSVGIILDTFDDKWYSEILNAVHREIAEKSNLQFILFVQDKQKLDVLQKLTGGKCEPIKVVKDKKGKREQTAGLNKEALIHICGPKDEIEQAMLQLKKMQISTPSIQRSFVSKDCSVQTEDVPLPKETKNEKTLKVLDNTQQLPHDDICSLKPNRHLSSALTGVHLSSSLAGEHLFTNQIGSTTKVQIKHDSGKTAKAGNQGIFQQISKSITEHNSSLNTSGKSNTGSFIREIDCLTYDALRYIFGDQFTNAFSTLRKDTEKVTVQIPSSEAWQSVEEKIALLRQEDLSLSFQEIEVLGSSVDMKSENVDVFVKLLHDQNKALIFGCDYNAVTKAKHLILVKCGRLKLTSRAKRQFIAESVDPSFIQTSAQITSASPSTEFVKDFVTKSGIRVSVYKKDITQLAVNAITNAANKNLDHIGGVAAAIAKASGSDLEVEGKEYVRKFGPLKVTEIVKTTAGRLPCQAVLHAVGPSWDDYQNKEECKQALQQTVYNCLKKSHDLNYTSLAVTSISSGIFGVPKAICADSYLAALQSFEDQHGSNTRLQHIHFVDTSDEMIGNIRDTFEKNWYIPILLNYVQQSFKF